MNQGKCPKCGATVASVDIESVTVRLGFQPKWHGVNYCCPGCHSVLGVSIDPIALKTDIVGEVIEALKLRGL